MSGQTWLFIGGGVLVIVWLATMIGAIRSTSQPLPALDRTPRTATVLGLFEENDSDVVRLEYLDGGGERHVVGLADLIHDSSIDRFVPGSTWQVYAFRVPEPRVLLTDAHEDVVRHGYSFSGIRIGSESGPVPRGPGSPFLHGQWRFEK